MARKSTVKRLPPEIRQEVDRLLAEGRCTLDQVVAHLRTLGSDVSRSAMGRYAQQFECVAAKMREAREVATAFAQELGDIPENDMGRTLVQLLHQMTFKVLMQRADEDGPVKPMDLMLLAKTIKESVGSTKISAELEMKLRDRTRAEALRDAAKAVESAGQERGLTSETVKAIKSRVLGM